MATGGARLSRGELARAVGRRLTQYRVEHGLTPEALAARLGIAADELLLVEEGKRLPEQEVLRDWFTTLGIAGLGYRPTHPLGAGSTGDPRSEANRQALIYCLRAYFAGVLAGGRMTRPPDRGDAATGCELAPRFVSQLEIAEGLRWLLACRADLYELVLDRYAVATADGDLGLSIKAIARWRGHAPETVSEKLTVALNLLLDRIFAERP